MAENHQEKGNSEPTNTKIEATIQYLYGCTGRYRQTQCFLFTIVLYLLYLHTYTNHACVDIKIYKEPRSSYTPPSHKSIYTIYTNLYGLLEQVVRPHHFRPHQNRLTHRPTRLPTGRRLHSRPEAELTHVDGKKLEQ